MKMRTRNIIAITVAIVAVLSIAFVVVLAVIRITPLKNLAEGSNSYQIYYSGKYQRGNEDFKYELLPPTTAVNRKYESVTMNELIDMNSFSVFKSWSQFKYLNGPRIKDHYESSHPSISRSSMLEIMTGSSAELDKKFSIVFNFSETKNITVKDSDGEEFSQDYDTMVVILEETDGAVRDITLYVYKYSNLAGSVNHAQYTDSHVGINLFYPLQIGAVTSEAIDAMYDVFDIDPNAKDEEPEEPDDGSEETPEE